MKKFFLLIITSLAFLPISSYADGDPLELVYYNIIVNEDLFSQASEQKQIIASSDYIYSVDQALRCFLYNYASLDTNTQLELLGVIQYLLSSGLITGGNNGGYNVSYSELTTLQVLMGGLANNPEKMAQLIGYMNEFIIQNLFISTSSHNSSSTLQNDVETMMTLNNCLTQLNLNPQLITNNDFLNSLYQAFENANSLLGQYGKDLMLFDLDLVGAGLYQYNSCTLPPSTSPTAKFQSASELQPLMVNLITGANQLYFAEMNSHLQMGILSMQD
ncbi:MAG: hypothetical protein KDK56_02650 [Simkania sp.]|nr:hypothetical protein [Simkania sp.]MCP5489954.1 hypothetical protein [Chlamydiales bacterium]